MHPIDFTESFLADHKNICEIQISSYRTHPQSLWDDRNCYSMSAKQLRRRYERLLQQVDENEEIAFDSIITMANGKAKKHIGLVDFNTSEKERAEQASWLLIQEYHVRRAALVFSGRSYHLYLGILLSHAEWVKFMGRILLLNLRDQTPVIDSRWVGHRLIGGYGSLRWSARSKPCLPTIIKEWDVDQNKQHLSPIAALAR